MQSINAGFQSLKTLIPHTDGEKLSKVGRSREGFLEEASRSRGEGTSRVILSLLLSGSHSPADGRIHLLSRAGEDETPAAEHAAQALHPGTGWRPSQPPCLSLLCVHILTRPLTWDAWVAILLILPTEPAYSLPGPVSSSVKDRGAGSGGSRRLF